MHGTGPRKALLLIGGEKIGGAEKRFGRVFTALSARDAHISLIINKTLHDSLIQHGVPLDLCRNIIVIKESFYIGNSPIRRIIGGFVISARIIREIRSRRIEFLHSMGFLLLMNFLVFRRLKDVRKGISLFDSRLDVEINGFLLKFLFRYEIGESAFIDFLSQDIKDAFSRKYGRYFNGRYFVSPCSFVDYTHIDLAGVAKENSVVFLARLVEDKNPFLFLEAVPLVIKKLSGKYHDLKFWIVGNGPLEEALRQRAHAMGIENSVVFTYSYDPFEILSRSRIFVSLQRVNNYPSQSLIEAMACRNSIVATDVGETWKLVDESTGIRVKPDAKEIAAAIVYLLDHPDAMRDMGEKARQKVLTEHTVERFSEYLMNDVYGS